MTKSSRTTTIHRATNVIIVVSIVLLILFVIEGKTKSALLQIVIIMLLVGSNFDLFDKAISLKSKPLAVLIICGWFAAIFGLLSAISALR